MVLRDLGILKAKDVLDDLVESGQLFLAEPGLAVHQRRTYKVLFLSFENLNVKFTVF